MPAEWFYEWAQVDSKTKQPYGIGLKDGSMFAFAGLWDRWTDKATGQKLETYGYYNGTKRGYRSKPQPNAGDSGPEGL